MIATFLEFVQWGQHQGFRYVNKCNTKLTYCRCQWPLACWDCGFESHRGAWMSVCCWMLCVV